MSTSLSSHQHLALPLNQLRRHLNINRRLLRLFRFLDAFHTAYALVAGPSTLTMEGHLDVLSSTFNGLYFLLEAVTIVDAMEIDGLALWGSEYEAVLRMEAQRCWFIALVCGATASCLRLSAARKELATLSGRLASMMAKGDKTAEQTAERRKGLERKAALEKGARTHFRRLLAGVLDLPLPGSAVGWIQAEPLTIGLAMMTTSVLTGVDVWERCGKEV
jgi:hypothetical protein